eukprot:273828-Chlamydomonas_euryale.AAC.8
MHSDNAASGQPKSGPDTWRNMQEGSRTRLKPAPNERAQAHMQKTERTLKRPAETRMDGASMFVGDCHGVLSAGRMCWRLPIPPPRTRQCAVHRSFNAYTPVPVLDAHARVFQGGTEGRSPTAGSANRLQDTGNRALCLPAAGHAGRDSHPLRLWSLLCLLAQRLLRTTTSADGRSGCAKDGDRCCLVEGLHGGRSRRALGCCWQQEHADYPDCQAPSGHFPRPDAFRTRKMCDSNNTRFCNSAGSTVAALNFLPSAMCHCARSLSSSLRARCAHRADTRAASLRTAPTRGARLPGRFSHGAARSVARARRGGGRQPPASVVV